VAVMGPADRSWGPMSTGPMSTAQRLAFLVPGGPLPIRLRAWDGSVAGPDDGPELVIRHRRALRRLLWSPDARGLAQAYIVGELDVVGDLGDGLRRVWRHARAFERVRIGPRDRARAVRTAVRLGAVGPRPGAPDIEARLNGPMRNRERDPKAIGDHDDLPDEFYALILDRRMVQSCAYWTSDALDYDLEQAQSDKLKLICRKLGLEPGMRMLDVGCGWGALAIHAARHHGVTVTGLTRSARQRELATARVAERGLSGAVDIRLQDYRDVDDGPYDAISAIEMGEHVGAEQYPVFAAALYRLLTPRGRVLVQQMSRGHHAPGGGLIEPYAGPDMHLRPVGTTVDLLERAGLEIRDVHALREHYVRTVQAWTVALEERWDEGVELVGEPMARAWRLGLAGATLAFEEGRMGVDQILAVRPTGDGVSGMPAIRA
jgi:cyclopropane-fatty-acyl-phospholipid synthase